MTNTSCSPELQRRLDSDPRLSGISVLGVDPGMMPTKITTGGLGTVIAAILTIVIHISSWLSPNGMFRLPGKSADDVLAAALDTGAPFGEKFKGLYMNGSQPKEFSLEAKDGEKRSTVWKASVQLARLKLAETVLEDWT